MKLFLWPLLEYTKNVMGNRHFNKNQINQNKISKQDNTIHAVKQKQGFYQPIHIQSSFICYCTTIVQIQASEAN